MAKLLSQDWNAAIGVMRRLARPQQHDHQARGPPGMRVCLCLLVLCCELEGGMHVTLGFEPWRPIPSEPLLFGGDQSQLFESRPSRLVDGMCSVS